MAKLDSIVKQHLVFSDQPIRQAMKLYDFSDQNSIIVEELDVQQGKARIDMVILGDYLHGLEFKSDGDTLRRLHHQMRFFSPAFEKLTIIVGYSHLYEVIDVIPSWWGIIVVEQTTNGCVIFDQIRDNEPNPELCGHAVLSLLTRHEIYKMALIHKLQIPKSATFDRLLDLVLDVIKIEDILDYVKVALINRSQLNQAFVAQ